MIRWHSCSALPYGTFDTTALVWVQTESAATVEVLVALRRLRRPGSSLRPRHGDRADPDTVTEYDVKVDGKRVWPLADSPFPPSVIRTRGPASTHRLQAIFGDAIPPRATMQVRLQARARSLEVYADPMATRPVDDWPEVLILLGDQLYADELTRSRDDAGRPPHPEKSARPAAAGRGGGFAEYERLYRHSWGDAEIRWLMSTVPTAMIFDDHDIRDDWNTSASWRADMNEKPWWRERIRAGLASSGCISTWQHESV